MKLSSTCVPAPMNAGPRMVELRTHGAALHDDPSLDPARGVDGAVDPPLDRLEHESVGLQQRGQLARVDPPAGQQLRRDRVAGVDEPLDGVGDLQLAPRRGARWRGPRRGCGGRRGTRRPGPGPTAGRSASPPVARRGPVASSSATPNWRGSDTGVSRISAAGIPGRCSPRAGLPGPDAGLLEVRPRTPAHSGGGGCRPGTSRTRRRRGSRGR